MIMSVMVEDPVITSEPRTVPSPNLSSLRFDQNEARLKFSRTAAALSAGGKVEMELADMFWGAYFGSCTDKYGVQWMFN